MSLNLEKFILSMEPGIVFDIDEIVDLFKSNTTSRSYVTFLLSKLYKEKKIDKTVNGKYYIPKEGILGALPVSKEEDVIQRYITDGRNIYGVFSGYRILNKWGLSQQYTIQKDVVTNKISSHTYYMKKLNVRLKKSRFVITNKNYKIAELFEVLKSYENKTLNENISNMEQQIAHYVNSQFSKREKMELLFYLYNFESSRTQKKFMSLLEYLDDTIINIERVYRSDEQ